jgi:hypothetical protein
MRDAALRSTAFRPVAAELKRRVKSLQAIQSAQWTQRRIHAFATYVEAFTPEKGRPFFTRKRQFSFGVALTLWPVLMVAFVPPRSLINRDLILFIPALLSEAAASVLFLQVRRKRKDRLAFWSTIAAAVTGEVTLAFLIAAFVIITRFS